MSGNETALGVKEVRFRNTAERGGRWRGLKSLAVDSAAQVPFRTGNTELTDLRYLSGEFVRAADATRRLAAAADLSQPHVNSVRADRLPGARPPAMPSKIFKYSRWYRSRGRGCLVPTAG